MQKFNVNDTIKAKKSDKKRRIMGVEVQPDGKIYYNYYDGTFTEAQELAQEISTKTMGRCLEATMSSWGAKE